MADILGKVVNEIGTWNFFKQNSQVIQLQERSIWSNTTLFAITQEQNGSLFKPLDCLH